jgi:hypothetical protein
MDSGFASIKALVETLPDIWKKFKELWTNAPGAMVEMLATGIVGAGKILVGLIMAGFQASYSIWTAIGSILGTIFVDTLNDYFSATTFGAWLGLKASQESNKDRAARHGRQFAGAISTAEQGLGTAYEMAKAPMVDLGKELNRQFKAATGMDVGATLTNKYVQNKQDIEDAKNKAKYELVTYERSELAPVDGNRNIRARRNNSWQELHQVGEVKEGTSGNYLSSLRVKVEPSYNYRDWAAVAESMSNPSTAAAGM